MRFPSLVFISLLVFANAGLFGKKKSTTEETPNLNELLAKFTIQTSETSDTTPTRTTTLTTTSTKTTSTTTKEKSKFKEFFGFGKDKSSTSSTPKSTTSTSTTTTKKGSSSSVAHGVHELINSLLKNTTKTSLLVSNATQKANGSIINNLILGLNGTLKVLNTTASPLGIQGLINSLHKNSTKLSNLTTVGNKNSTKLVLFINGTTSNQTQGINSLISGLLSNKSTNITVKPSNGLQDLIIDLKRNSTQSSRNGTTTKAANKEPFQLDEACLNNPCKNSGKCVKDSFNSLGYRCECTTLFTGNTCEEMNHCFSNPCKNGGICHNLRLSFWCTCQKGFTGTQCEKGYAMSTFKPFAIDTSTQHKFACLNNICQNGGTCFNFTMGIHCQCPSSHKGLRCEQAFGTPSSLILTKSGVPTKAQVKDACVTNPCKNGGTCESFADGLIHYCYCRSPFYGENCEKNAYPN